VALPRSLPQTLAAGAELKNTFCLTRDANAFLSQHIGDLENLETLEHYEASVEVYRRLFRLEPEVVAYDLHPEYLATKYALSLPQEDKVAVQHHHGHVAARLVEHCREDAVIGVSMDGLGYGHDGRLWGGEIFVCDLTGYRRVAHFEELPLPGGAAAIAHPWRTALGWSYALLGREGLDRAGALLSRPGADGGAAAGPPTDEEVSALLRQVDLGVNSPLTTSCGRLFDAVAALAGVRRSITYEGQAAIELEMMAYGQEPAAGAYDWTHDGDAGSAAGGERHGASYWMDASAAGPAPAVVRLAPLFGGVIADLEAGAAPGVVGARLHATVADIVSGLCRRVRESGGPSAVVLAGGVFQNRLLAELCEHRLEAAGFDVLAAGLVPVNDGGVSLGQAAVAGYTVLERRGELR
jgi:hydrogenase maturation protein HypF